MVRSDRHNTLSSESTLAIQFPPLIWILAKSDDVKLTTLLAEDLVGVSCFLDPVASQVMFPDCYWLQDMRFRRWAIIGQTLLIKSEMGHRLSMSNSLFTHLYVVLNSQGSSAKLSQTYPNCLSVHVNGLFRLSWLTRVWNLIYRMWLSLHQFREVV